MPVPAAKSKSPRSSHSGGPTRGSTAKPPARSERKAAPPPAKGGGGKRPQKVSAFSGLTLGTAPGGGAGGASLMAGLGESLLGHAGGLFTSGEGGRADSVQALKAERWGGDVSSGGGNGARQSSIIRETLKAFINPDKSRNRLRRISSELTVTENGISEKVPVEDILFFHLRGEKYGPRAKVFDEGWQFLGVSGGASLHWTHNWLKTIGAEGTVFVRGAPLSLRRFEEVASAGLIGRDAPISWGLSTQVRRKGAEDRLVVRSDEVPYHQFMKTYAGPLRTKPATKGQRVVYIQWPDGSAGVLSAHEFARLSAKKELPYAIRVGKGVLKEPFFSPDNVVLKGEVEALENLDDVLRWAKTPRTVGLPFPRVLRRK